MRIVNEGKSIIKMWTDGVPVEDQAMQQLKNCVQMPFIYKWIAAMPDVHWGCGSTVGSVIPTDRAIIPAAVGVDIGCGMTAVPLGRKASDLPDNLAPIRTRIEAAVPHGRTAGGGPEDKGAWADVPNDVINAEKQIAPAFASMCVKHPKLARSRLLNQLGTLGSGNHFIELCLDENDNVWLMLHSGSRGVGNRIGSYFIELAKREMERFWISLPDRDLAYLPEGSQYFADYVAALNWAQNYARINRHLMVKAIWRALAEPLHFSEFGWPPEDSIVTCHHNYVQREKHYGKDVWITRKGAVSARSGEIGIIPGSMGAKSYIVRGLGNAESFCSCSHGAGRTMSRTEARKRFSMEDHAKATFGVECRKDEGVLDETPGAYKDIDAVMAAQTDLVEVVRTLKQVLCVKG